MRITCWQSSQLLWSSIFKTTHKAENSCIWRSSWEGCAGIFWPKNTCRHLGFLHSSIIEPAALWSAPSCLAEFSTIPRRTGASPLAVPQGTPAQCSQGPLEPGGHTLSLCNPFLDGVACRRSFVLAVVEVWRWVLVVGGAAGEGKELDFGFHQKQKIFQFNSPWTSCHHLLQIPLPPSSPKHPYFTRFHSAYCVHFPSVDSLGSSTELLFHPWCSQLCGGTHELCRAGLGNRSWNKTGIHLLLAFYVAVRFSGCSPWCWDPNDNSAPQQDPEAHRDIAPACIWRVFGSRCQPSQITFCSAIRTCASRVTDSLVCTRICGGVQLILAIMPATVRCGSESKLQVGQSPLWWCSCLFPDPNELCLAWIFVIRWIELLHLNRAGMCKTVKLE